MDASDRAKRILTSMESYVEGSLLKDKFREESNEIPADTLGIYVNNINKKELVVVGREGIGLCRQGEVEYIRYSDILNVKSPAKEFEPVISLGMRNGASISVPILHGKGQTKDVYEFVRFLIRSIQGAQRAKEGSL